MTDPVIAELEVAAEAAAIHRGYRPSAGAMALARLEAHEQLCGVRYLGIIERVRRLEGVIVAATGSLLVMMLGIILTMVLHAPR